MKIPRSVAAEIAIQAEAAAPVETCGYLAGNGTEVVKHFPMTNMDRSETHFSFNPEEQFQVIKAARVLDLHLIGVYHSHPASPARPSEEDIRLAHDPDIIHLIISLEDARNDLKAFKIIAGQVTAEAIEIV